MEAPERIDWNGKQNAVAGSHPPKSIVSVTSEWDIMAPKKTTVSTGLIRHMPVFPKNMQS